MTIAKQQDEIFISHIKAIANTIVIPIILILSSQAIASGVIWIAFMATVYQIVNKPLNKRYFYIYTTIVIQTTTLLTIALYIIINTKGPS